VYIGANAAQLRFIIGPERGVTQLDQLIKA